MSRPRKSSTATRGEARAARSAPDRDARSRGIVADDHVIFAEGVRGLLEPEFAIVAVVSDGQALIDSVRAMSPDFVVVDISMPRRNGIDAIRQLKKEFPRLAAICLTMHADRMYLAEAMQAGAIGFVAKHAAATELRQAIRTGLRGGSYVSPLVGGRGPMHGRPFATRAGSRALFKLTARQRQVLQLVAEGRTAREIATVLNLTQKTIEFHKYRIMASLGLDSSAAMIQFAVLHGMVAG